MIVLAAASLSPVAAMDPIPEKPGWHGFVLLGLGSQTVESNLIAGSAAKELGEEEIDSVFDPPGSNSDVVALLSGELGYRLEGSQTYIAAGNLLEDLVRYDFTSRLGVRQGMGKAGDLGVDLLFNTIPARVWEDPYLTGTEREGTDRSSSGGRITWDRIFGTGLEIELIGRKIEIDLERSGTNLGLTPEEIEMLDRNGSMGQARMAYHFRIGERHAIVPRVTVSRENLDGEAVAYDSTGFDLAYVYRNPKIFLTLTADANTRTYDEENPIYGQETDSDVVGGSITAIFPSWLPGKWSAGLTFVAYDEDSDVDFFDGTISSIGLVTTRIW